MTDHGVLLVAPLGPRHSTFAARIHDAGYVVTQVDAAASLVGEMRFLLPTVATVHVDVGEDDGIGGSGNEVRGNNQISVSMCG
jgi:hypothetical protein